ncbi:hypothetical protein PQR62_14120 [Herbaspirillum lusitanum]|uniref:Uncharacterized protein n=1 Tax=Herbaspirillum lusitanum TaxID=213312 RepID=A0ABW9ABN3_9BURK
MKFTGLVRIPALPAAKNGRGACRCIRMARFTFVNSGSGSVAVAHAYGKVSCAASRRHFYAAGSPDSADCFKAAACRSS